MYRLLKVSSGMELGLSLGTSALDMKYLGQGLNLLQVPESSYILGSDTV